MKKLLALMLAMLMVLSLAACGSKETADTPDTSDTSNSQEETTITTVTPGKLTVATSPDFAPYEFYAIDDAGNASLAGFDLALAGYIAD